MKLGAYARIIWRESRGARGQMGFFVACIALGVSAVVGVSSTVDSFEISLRSQSQALLGADLAVEARRPLPDLDAAFESVPGTIDATSVIELPTMASVSTPKRKSRLAALEAVDGEFPLRGKLVLSEDRPLQELLEGDAVVADPSILRELGIGVGDEVRLGGMTFRVAASIVSSTDRMDFASALSPRMFISNESLMKSGLISFGARVKYRSIYRFSEGFNRSELADIRKQISKSTEESSYLKVESHDQAQPAMRRALERVETFLGLVALLSLLLGGIGVSQVVSTWLASRLSSIAILRCLGLRPAEIVRLYLAYVVGVSIIGSLLGCVAGGLAPSVLVELLPDFAGGAEVQAHIKTSTMLRGLALGVFVSALFSLQPLSAVWRVPPARVLRSSAAPLKAPAGITVASVVALVGAVFIAAWLQSGQVEVGVIFSIALFATGLLATATARGVLFAIGKIPRGRLGPYLRNGIAALARPSAGTVGAIVALSLGVLVVSTLHLVESRLRRELDQDLPKDAPSSYLLGVQPSQEKELHQLLNDSGAEAVASVPVTMARLVSIDGVSVKDLAKSNKREGRPRWGLRREQRLSSFKDLPTSNRLVKGELWTDPRPEISVEERYANDLGIKIGSMLQFNVQGVDFEFVATSIRKVEWRSFEMNFFFVVEPGTLEGAPRFQLTGVRLPKTNELETQDRVVEKFPNVTVIQVREIIEKVSEILQGIALGVQALGGFAVITGLVILAGAVSSTTIRRRRESALLRALGLTKRGVATLLAIEYALLGATAGAVGAGGAWGLSYAILERLLEFEAQIPASFVPLSILTSAVLVAGCGVLASQRALRASPVELLRAE
ncbi:MAG: FtsX-like permease family protein [Planctomycetota bacterium]